MNVDICVIGGGSGGLSVAAIAAQMGAKTVLLEKYKMGGDCLNYGCIPSKALLAAGHAAQSVRGADRFGITATGPESRSEDVYGRVRGIIGAIQPQDSEERFEGLGVKVIKAAGKFVGRQEVRADGVFIKARRVVVSTGSSVFVSPIPGLDKVPYLTNETIFNRDKLPQHLIVIGGGPVGIELAQAHRDLGCEVTVLEMFSIMPKDDAELVDVIRQQVLRDGLDVREHVKINRVEPYADGIRVVIEKEGCEEAVDGSHLLVATGRRPNVAELDLEGAGVEYSERGIIVDDRLRTTNKKVFAIGDVAGGSMFTHVASYHAGVVIKNALFRLPVKVDYSAVPWVTYTAPELAQVGLNEESAKQVGKSFRVLRWSFHENDRAQAEGVTDGLIKAIVTPKGHILGCGIVGSHAGELIQPWVLAISEKLKIAAMASMIAPYPTLGEVSKRAGISFYTPSLFSDRTRNIVKFLSKFG